MPIALRRRSVLLGSAALAAGGALPVSLGFAQTTAPVRRNHALLVAVTEYPNLFQSEWLVGPNNDATLAREYLLTDAPVPFAPEDVTVLASNLDIAAAPPTLAAIRGEMARIAEAASDGDFVYLHFAGHGIQQPARDPAAEVDGMDQVFMPVDVERMTRALGYWPNGYVDKDIRADIEAIRRKGARVWAIFDCCHSATITRALDLVPEGEVARKIDLSRYDIPDDMWAEGTSRSLGVEAAMTPRSMFGPAGEVGLEGDLAPMVAFFAAQTVEVTPEMPLPRESETPVQMGLFSFTLLTKLRENPRVSYRQLGQAIHHAYIGMNRTRPTPLFEGALNAPVFDIADGAPYVPQWRITGTGTAREIAAGHMHQLAPGTRLAVLAEPNHTLAQALGVVQVGRAAALQSRLAPIPAEEEDPDLPAIALADIPENAYALLIERVVDFELVVARPRTGGPHSDAAAEVTEALEAIAADERLPIRLRLVDPDAQADLRFDIRSEAEVADLMRGQGLVEDADAPLLERAAASVAPRLWLLDNSAVLSLRSHQRPFSRALGPEGIAPVTLWMRDSLTAVYRATNLGRLATFDDFGESDVQVAVTRLPELFSQLDTGERLELHRTGVVTPGNTVHVRVENTGTTPVVVNILYIGSDYSITSMLPEPATLRGRIPREPNAAYSEEVLEFNDKTFGRERLFVIVTAAQSQDNPLDLSFLEQGGVRAVGPAPAAMSGFGAMIETMATGATTRGGTSLAARRAASASQRGAVYVFSVDNVPTG